ncbi:hypothetical protein GCM10023322_48160 [Rugosimonospora acidiphila]|uniref:Uncharacterized protein n=1 Tax=Rugosimonospora acidiphila TaxID=556531 RepID=A0ABP9S6F1_9ACTN
MNVDCETFSGFQLNRLMKNVYSVGSSVNTEKMSSAGTVSRAPAGPLRTRATRRDPDLATPVAGRLAVIVDVSAMNWTLPSHWLDGGCRPATGSGLVLALGLPVAWEVNANRVSDELI